MRPVVLRVSATNKRERCRERLVRSVRLARHERCLHLPQHSRLAACRLTNNRRLGSTAAPTLSTVSVDVLDGAVSASYKPVDADEPLGASVPRTSTGVPAAAD